MRPTRLPPAAAALLLLAAVGGCAEAGTYGAVAIERRRAMNDLQARAIMAATCDIALGAYFRELSEAERLYVGLVCGGMFPDRAGAPASPASADTERPEIMPVPSGGGGDAAGG